MNNYEWFKKLDASVTKHPSILEAINSDEIYKLIYLELQCRSQLYPTDQMKSVEAFFDKILLNIKDSINRHNPIAFHKQLENLSSYLGILPDMDYSADFIERANRDHLLIEHIKNKTVYVIGDSHVCFFSGNESLAFIPIGNGINTCEQICELPFSVFHMGPCLAYNSTFYNTSTKFKEKLDYLLDELIEPGARIMFVMGEIDIRAHVFKESEKRGCSFKDIVDNIIIHYFDMMNGVREKGYDVLCFAPIASQSDDTPPSDIFKRFGSEVERNIATDYFTKELCEECRKTDIKLISILDRMITSDYHTKKECLCNDGCHLSQSMRNIVMERMSDLIKP